jgi:hypothetical protein
VLKITSFEELSQLLLGILELSLVDYSDSSNFQTIQIEEGEYSITDFCSLSPF